MPFGLRNCFTSSQNKLLMVWDLNTGTCIVPPLNHPRKWSRRTVFNVELPMVPDDFESHTEAGTALKCYGYLCFRQAASFLRGGWGQEKFSAFIVGCFLLNFAPQVRRQVPVFLMRHWKSRWNSCLLEPVEIIKQRAHCLNVVRRGRSESQCEGVGVGRNLELNFFWPLNLRFTKKKSNVSSLKAKWKLLLAQCSPFLAIGYFKWEE